MAIRSGFIVEDHVDAQAWLAQALAEGFPGIRVTVTGTLLAARGWLAENPDPDIALIDLGLPDGDGGALIAELAQRAPQTLCVVTTIYDDDRHLFSALRAGAQGYLLKDQGLAQIAELLRGIATGNPPLSPAIARRLLGYFRPVPERPGLTQRETEVLSLIARGVTLPEVARLLGLSPHTVSGYAKEIYRKLNVSCRAEAALSAQRMGLLD